MLVGRASVAEWSIAPRCRRGASGLRGFESLPAHHSSTAHLKVGCFCRILEGMKRILIIGIAAFFIFIPLAASAQVPPLVPECGVYGENGFGPYCQACDLLKLANRLIDFGVYLAIIIATLMFTYAGVLYVTAASQSGAGAIDKAKKIFWSVFWGLVIVLSSWLALNVLLSVFTGNGLAFWSEIRCVEFAEVYDSQGNLSISPWVPIKPKPLPEGAIDHKTAILQLTAAGIDVRSTSGVVA